MPLGGFSYQESHFVSRQEMNLLKSENCMNVIYAYLPTKCKIDLYTQTQYL